MSPADADGAGAWVDEAAPADGYPADLDGTAVLVDGSGVAIRPICPSDGPALVAFHERLSPDTAYRRFLGIHPHLCPDEVYHYTHVDYRDRLALIAVAGGQMVAVARYDRHPEKDLAEVAFVVADGYQRRGLGTLLLRRLAAAALARGITRFDAELLEGNSLMRGVFHHAGFQCVEHHGGGTLDLSFALDPEPSAIVPAG